MSASSPAQHTGSRPILAESSPSRSATSTTTTTGQGQGLARNPSLRSARPIRKAPVRTSIGNDVVAEEEARAANAQVIADLKTQVERAEQASDHYRKQLDAMQKRLDDVANDTTEAEEREFQLRTQIDKMQAELRDNVRQNRELGLSYESDKKLLLQERENQSNKESELQSVVNRLTETLKLRNQEIANTAPRDLSNRGLADKENQQMILSGSSDSKADQDYLKILESKDSIIASLRLEIADFHLSMAEQQHMGDGQSQALEKELLDIKMRNARLQEENESFQMLLSEKTLKGDFMHEHPPSHGTQINSLAEELETVGEQVELTPESYRQLELENKTLRDSNKALTLYIDKIIGRMLQHEGFEHIITDKDDDAPAPLAKLVNTEKTLPRLPAQQAQPLQQQDMTSSNAVVPNSAQEPSKPSVVSASAATATAAAASAASVAAGFLQRARSVVSRPAVTPRPRPMSYIQHGPAGVSANENPETAPSIPLSRGNHRRARSDQANDVGSISGTLAAQQSNRNSMYRASSGGAISPVMTHKPPSPLSSKRTSYVQSNRPGSSSNSVISEQSLDTGERDSTTDASSARASVYGASSINTNTNPNTNTSILPGAVMKQNQLRPLRLVQEQADEDAQKKSNRTSWMGTWFNKVPGGVGGGGGETPT